LPGDVHDFALEIDDEHNVGGELAADGRNIRLDNEGIYTGEAIRLLSDIFTQGCREHNRVAANFTITYDQEQNDVHEYSASICMKRRPEAVQVATRQESPPPTKRARLASGVVLPSEPWRSAVGLQALARGIPREKYNRIRTEGARRVKEAARRKRHLERTLHGIRKSHAQVRRHNQQLLAAGLPPEEELHSETETEAEPAFYQMQRRQRTGQGTVYPALLERT
jgi:hypothetical protein